MSLCADISKPFDTPCAALRILIILRPILVLLGRVSPSVRCSTKSREMDTLIIPDDEENDVLIIDLDGEFPELRESLMLDPEIVEEELAVC